MSPQITRFLTGKGRKKKKKHIQSFTIVKASADCQVPKTRILFWLLSLIKCTEDLELNII